MFCFHCLSPWCVKQNCCLRSKVPLIFARALLSNKNQLNFLLWREPRQRPFPVTAIWCKWILWPLLFPICSIPHTHTHAHRPTIPECKKDRISASAQLGFSLQLFRETRNNLTLRAVGNIKISFLLRLSLRGLGRSM